MHIFIHSFIHTFIRTSLYIYAFIYSIYLPYLFTVFTGINSITVFYVLHQPLNFRPSQIGYLFTEVNAMKFIGASLVNFILIHKMKWNDYSIIMMASLMYGGFTLSLALAQKEWHIYLGKALF